MVGPWFHRVANVARATPLFLGHYQHHLPADLGYYDLRLPEVRQQQADIASHYGIHGFCYSRWGCPKSMDKSHIDTFQRQLLFRKVRCRQLEKIAFSPQFANLLL